MVLPHPLMHVCASRSAIVAGSTKGRVKSGMGVPLELGAPRSASRREKERRGERQDASTSIRKPNDGVSDYRGCLREQGARAVEKLVLYDVKLTLGHWILLSPHSFSLSAPATTTLLLSSSRAQGPRITPWID